MKTKIFSFILALCLSANSMHATNKNHSSSEQSHEKNFKLILANIHRKAKISLPNNVKNVLPFDVKERIYQYYNEDPFTINYKSTEEAIANLLPYFFDRNKQTLERLQEGKRAAILVIGQTGAGKSTLIGGLLSHKFVFEEQEETRTLKNGRTLFIKKKVLANKNLVGPKIGHSTASSETIFPKAYLDQETSLAFIDTAGLGDTRNNGEAINICSALGLRSLIEEIGSVQCIIGTISYNNFIERKGSKAFSHLLNVTSNLLKNKSSETLTSSMVLAFTKVPENITKKDINDELELRCTDLILKEEDGNMTKDDKIVDNIYKILFPSFYGLKNKKNIPFFLIKQGDLLKQDLVRKNMLSTLQNTIKVHKKDIGLALSLDYRHLLEKTKEWLTKRVDVANDIRHKEEVEGTVAHITGYLSFKQAQLLEQEKRLQQLTDSNSQDTKRKREHFVTSLINSIQNNNQRIQYLDQEIKKSKQEKDNQKQRMDRLNTNKIIFYKSISSSHDNKTNKYNYRYEEQDVPIHHIIYTGDNTKDPECGQHLNGHYKIIVITKNYDQGILKMMLANSLSGGTYVKTGLLTIGALATGAVGLLDLASLQCQRPYDFEIYAKKKDIYNNQIRGCKDTIANLNNKLLKCKKAKESLKKETQYCTYQLDEVISNLWHQKELTKQTNKEINIYSEEIKKMRFDLKNLQNNVKLLNEKIKKNQVIPYIITQVAPFIGFHNNCKDDIDACKRYIDSVKKNNQNKNNNSNINSKHSDNQPGLLLDNNNNIEGEEEIKEDDSYKENISSSSNRNFSVTSSVTLGTVGIISRLKKKN